MQKRTYIEITYSDGNRCVCVNQEEVDAMTEGYEPDEWSSREVEMTQDEYDRLPEFEA
jgi:hypothetical protein